MNGKRVVIITGGTGALGKELAIRHLHQNDEVIVTGRNASRLKALQDEQNDPAFHVYALELTDYEAVKTFCAWVQVRYGRCDLLYNNAGTAVFKSFVEMNQTEILETIQANLNGLLFMTKAFLPMMLRARTGQIINIASLAGHVATSKAAVYAATKAAVIRFSEGLRHELAGTGLSVTCVMPGPIDTPFLDRADPTGMYRQKVAKYLLTPEQTAEAILRAVDKKRPELMLPASLGWLTRCYLFLPHRFKNWLSPLLNRK